MKRLRRRALILGSTILLALTSQSAASAGVGEFVDDVLGGLSVSDPEDPHLLCVEVGVEEKTPICIGCYDVALGLTSCEPECNPRIDGPLVVQCM